MRRPFSNDLSSFCETSSCRRPKMVERGERERERERGRKREEDMKKSRKKKMMKENKTEDKRV